MEFKNNLNCISIYSYIKFSKYFYNTALHLAVILKNNQIIQILTNSKNIDINIKDDIHNFKII